MPRIILHKAKLKRKLLDVPPDILRAAMPEIVNLLVHLAQRFAPRKTGKMANQIEGEVLRYGFVGRVTPRGRVAHLVHNPTGRSVSRPKTTGRSASKHRAALEHDRPPVMRFWDRGSGKWVFATKIERGPQRGVPFLEMALAAGESGIARILKTTGDKVVGGIE